MSARILTVDDDPSIRTTVAMVLEEAGIEVDFAEGGQEAIEKIRQGFRGLILLDIMMPEMDGWQTLETIVDQGLYTGNVVCMLTAVLDPGPEMESLKEYVLDYVRKPFTPDELVAAVEDALSYCVA
jgi:DNA-binding response OmpR family regulator